MSRHRNPQRRTPILPPDEIWERSHEAMIVGCRSYQNSIIHLVRDVSIYKTHPGLNEGEAINTCLHVVNYLVINLKITEH